MERTVALSLNNFVSLPPTLCGASNIAIDEIKIDLANLYHHYYLDSYGITPPDPDPAHFEYARFICPDEHFRIAGGGLGISTAARRGRSTDLGQAFCRLFLHDHLDIVHFAHLHDVLDRDEASFAPVVVERVAAGDTPDYLCATRASEVFVAESKGRYSPVQFNGSEFCKWRRQFDRIVLKNRNGEIKSVKGYIVETAFGTESKPSSKSRLFAEDPSTGGSDALDAQETDFLANRVMSLHYGNIARKLGQELLAAALTYHFVVSEELRFPATAWELLIPGVSKEPFVGGYFSPDGRDPQWEQIGRSLVLRQHPFRLNHTRGTFFGLTESAFKSIVASARGISAFGQLPRLDRLVQVHSALSLLRDGSALGPVDFFRPMSSSIY